MAEKIGMTDGYDPAFDFRWIKWVSENKPAILITKNPKILYEKITELNCDYNIIVHCTITGNGGSKIEPNVPDYKESLEYLYKFVDLLGNKRVVLRIDPIMPIAEYIQNAITVYNEAKNKLQENMCRLRISFYDNYPHTEKRLHDIGIDIKYKTFDIPLHIRKKVWRDMGQPELCAEADMPSRPCLSEYDCEILGVEPAPTGNYQRNKCNCLANKYELLNIKQQCMHKCAYCFWKKDHSASKKLF